MKTADVANVAKDTVVQYPLTANQMEFVNMVIDHLAARSVLTDDDLIASPFTDFGATGPQALF